MIYLQPSIIMFNSVNLKELILITRKIVNLYFLTLILHLKDQSVI